MPVTTSRFSLAARRRTTTSPAGKASHGDTKHGEKFSTGTPTSSSASAPHSNDTAATPPNPAHQNVGPILAIYGFKRVLSVIKYKELMPDPFDFILSPLSITQASMRSSRKSAAPGAPEKLGDLFAGCFMEIFKIEIQLLESFLMPRKLTQGPTEEGAERDVHGLPLMPRFLSLLPLPVQAGVNFLRQALPFVEWVFFAVFGRGPVHACWIFTFWAW